MDRKKTPKILKVYWSKREAKIGEKVKLEAITQHAAGKTATIQIYEYRKKNRIIEETKVPVRESKISTSWKVKYLPDIFGEEPPEYRFKVSISKTSRTSKTLYLKAEVVNIALSFDDGPHTAELTVGENQTVAVLDVLRKKKIKAVFFLQTHAPHRANCSIGRKLVQRMAKEGHIIGIHTGSLEDHVDHAVRVQQKPEDVNGDGSPDGGNGLESDLIRAKQLIKSLIGSNPEFVRAPNGRYRAHKEVIPTYRRQKLIHIAWDIDSMDNIKKKGRKRTVEEVKEELEKSFKAVKSKEVIVLFHDLNPTTSGKLEDYITTIREAILEGKRIPRLIISTKELNSLLRRKGIR